MAHGHVIWLFHRIKVIGILKRKISHEIVVYAYGATGSHNIQRSSLIMPLEFNTFINIDIKSIAMGHNSCRAGTLWPSNGILCVCVCVLCSFLSGKWERSTWRISALEKHKQFFYDLLTDSRRMAYLPKHENKIMILWFFFGGSCFLVYEYKIHCIYYYLGL